MQKTEQQAGLGMSFCEEEGRITVFRKTLEALEWPSHYRFLYNRKMKQIAVQACGAEEAGAHQSHRGAAGLSDRHTLQGFGSAYIIISWQNPLCRNMVRTLCL